MWWNLKHNETGGDFLLICETGKMVFINSLSILGKWFFILLIHD